jgi:hypothetical protein
MDEPICETCGEPIEGSPRVVQVPIFNARTWTLIGFDDLLYHPNCTP